MKIILRVLCVLGGFFCLVIFWIAFTVPCTYVFDRDGDKIRTVQFRGAGIMTPS